MNLPFTILLLDGGILSTLSLLIALLLFLGIVVFVLVVPQSAWQKDAEIPVEKWNELTTDKENSDG